MPGSKYGYGQMKKAKTTLMAKKKKKPRVVKNSVRKGSTRSA